MFCRNKHNFVTLKAYFCRDKHMGVATKDVFCRDKHVFVATEMILEAAPASDSNSTNRPVRTVSVDVKQPWTLYRSIYTGIA